MPTSQLLARKRSKRQLYNSYSLRWPIYIFNLVDITKLPCYPHRRSTTVSLEIFTLYYLLRSLMIKFPYFHLELKSAIAYLA